MIIEQTVEIPADHRILLELPSSVPIGIKARVEINIPVFSVKGQTYPAASSLVEIEDVRKLLQKEMAGKGTSQVTAASGDGWEAHVKESYAEP